MRRRGRQAPCIRGRRNGRPTSSGGAVRRIARDLAPERRVDRGGVQQPAVPTFAEALRDWLELGFISFGGPAGQIALMRQELVERRRWISEGRFLHALNYCMVLPGPEARTAPLTAIAAAVVGVIVNLALLLAAHVLWPQRRPAGNSICPRR